MEKGMIQKILKYFFENHSEEVLPAMKEFFNDDKIDRGGSLNIQNDREESLFMEWITFDYRLKNGSSLIDNFISKNPLGMSKNELKIYNDLQTNKYGFFEIIKVKRDSYLDLEFLQSGKIYRVSEKMGTHNAHPKTTMMCRVSNVGDHWEIVGSDPIGFPIHHTERMKKLIRKDKTKYTPKETRELLIQKDNQPSNFEKNLKMSNEDITKKQNEIRKLVEKCLLKKNSTATFNDILEIVYKAKNSDDMAKIIYLLENTKSVPTQELLDLTSSVWNYFPHQSLDGESPVEKAKELYGER